jgi:hypothetical protein
LRSGFTRTALSRPKKLFAARPNPEGERPGFTRAALFESGREAFPSKFNSKIKRPGFTRAAHFRLIREVLTPRFNLARSVGAAQILGKRNLRGTLWKAVHECENPAAGLTSGGVRSVVCIAATFDRISGQYIFSIRGGDAE